MKLNHDGFEFQVTMRGCSSEKEIVLGSKTVLELKNKRKREKGFSKVRLTVTAQPKDTQRRRRGRRHERVLVMMLLLLSFHSPPSRPSSLGSGANNITKEQQQGAILGPLGCRPRAKSGSAVIFVQGLRAALRTKRVAGGRGPKKHER